MHCFNFCLYWKTFIVPSILNNSFAGKSILGLKVFSFSAWKISPHALLAFNVSVEKSAVILMGLHLCVTYFFSLTAFNILSLVSEVVVLMMMCHGEVLF
jgi:hypothetical protein